MNYENKTTTPLQLAIYFAIMALCSTLNFGCQKSEFEKPEYKNEVFSASYINNNLPDLTPKEKQKSVKQLIELSLNKQNHNLKSNEIIPIISARWLIETTINTNYANLYDSTLYDFSKKIVDISLEIVGYNPSGEPLVNLDEIVEKYNLIKDEVELINATGNYTFYLASIQLKEIENSTIRLMVILSKAKKNQNSYKSYIPYSHLPWVIAPNQTPIPFNTSDNYPPIPPDCTSSNSTMLPNWAGYYITEKLMANRGRLDLPTGEYLLKCNIHFKVMVI